MTEKIRAVLVDDEPLALEGLRLRLDKIAAIEVVGEGADGDEAIQLCQTLQPDVMFIDLQLPGLNGLEVVQAIQAEMLPLIVFVSAYGEYAIDAFELNAIDYLLKPVSVGRLSKTVERLAQRLTPQSDHQEKFRLLKALGDSSGLEISELEEWLQTDQPLPQQYRQELVIKNRDNEKVFLNVKDIRWIDAAGDYMCIHTHDETHIVRITMKKLVSELDGNVFQRIHKSTLVNVFCINSIAPLRNNESVLDLGNDVKLKVSRNYSSAIMNILDSRNK